ncbi:hypothetical protein ACP70R_003275 [Stipagrostis hirtigluma subsp. patula]
MAAPQAPITTTASRFTPETARGRHVFEIAGHGLLKGLGSGNFIRSGTFTVGGHDWCIAYYPNGLGDWIEDYVGVFLRLVSESTKARVHFGLRLVNPATGASSPAHTIAWEFSSVNSSRGSGIFMRRSKLAASYLHDDQLVIECDVTVIMGTPVAKSEIMSDVQIPSSVLLDNIGNLLETGEGADVTFVVQGEAFPAHKIVLAMQSPVFKAELYGPMSDEKTKTITIEDMHPAVFKALLYFVYKDSLPAMDDLDAGESDEMVKHLLVAADKYAMERMKVMCECILGSTVDVESVAATLALADQHHCSHLKDTCIEFINAPNRMDNVIASQGYAHLKRACPAVIMEMWEKSTKFRRNI